MTPLELLQANLAADPSVAPEFAAAVKAARIQQLLDDDKAFWAAYDEDGTYGAES